MNPAGLNLISVTYGEGSRVKRLFCSPCEGFFGLPSRFNRFVAEWFSEIRDAVTAATGRVPGHTPAEQLGVPSSSFVLLVMLFAPVLVAGALLFGQSDHAMLLLLGLLCCGMFAAFGISRLHRGQPPRSRWHKIWTSVLLVAIIVIPTRLFLLGAYSVKGDSASPEIPQGSRILVWKPAREFTPGDIIAYDHEGNTFVGRVIGVREGTVTVNRNRGGDDAIQRSRVIGKVVSVYWRASPRGAN
jgi:hypothetical protein